MDKYFVFWVLIALVLSSFIGYYLYYHKVKNPSKINIYLAFSRSIVFFLIMLLFINPSITEELLIPQKAKLSVLIDNSSSIKFFKRDSLIINILDSFKNNKRLNKKFNIDYYSFGNTFQLNDTLNFDESQTDISIPLEGISNLQKTMINPIVLLSDGNQTIGNDYQYTSIKEPVFPIIIGDTSRYRDVKISQINVNRYSFINNKFLVETIIQYEGNQPVRLRYSIYNKGKSIFNKLIDFNEKNTSTILKTFIKSSQEGLNFYTSKIQYLENEKNIVNNTKKFSVEVINKQSKVLIVSSFNHPDLGALKKVIESDKQKKVKIELITNLELQINDYQLVILYQPNNKFNLILKQLNTNKSSFMMITGTKTDWSFINNKSLGISKNNINKFENFSATFNSKFLNFSQKNIGFEDLPPLLDYFGELSISVPYQTLLYQNINGYSSPMPLLITTNESNHKKVFLFGEGLWKWRSSSFLKENSFQYFDEFIGSIIQYASNKKIRNRLDLDIKSSYDINSKILISAFYVDENYQFDNRASLLFTIINKDTDEKKILPFSLSDASYQLDLNSLDSGKYEYIVSVSGQKISKKGNFLVNDFLVEEQFTNANTAKLEYLAEKTKGAIFFEDNYDLLVDNLLNDNRFLIEQESKNISSNLINKKWMMLLILILLSCEWFVRKYIGKV